LGQLADDTGEKTKGSSICVVDLEKVKRFTKLNF
jgi:hypothetical protein